MVLSHAPLPHLFLDRDGTLIHEEHYLRDPDKVVLEDGVVEGLKRFQSSGYRLVVVSNQSGLSRSLITPSELCAVNSRIATLLRLEGITIDSWHHCPHLPEHGCACRKPLTGMFLEAEAVYPVDWTKSIMVGDKSSDVDAGLALGVRSALVITGYGQRYVAWAKQRDVLVVTSLLDLATSILP